MLEILTSFGAAITIIAFVYGIFRNFKNDIQAQIEKHEQRMEDRWAAQDARYEARWAAQEVKYETRSAAFEAKLISIEEKLFYAMTGKRIEEVILEEKKKNPKTNP